MSRSSRCPPLFFPLCVGTYLVACGGRSELPEGNPILEAGGTSTAGTVARSTGGHVGLGGSVLVATGGMINTVVTGGTSSHTGGSVGLATGGRVGTGSAFGTGGTEESGGAGTGGLLTGGRFGSSATGGKSFGIGGTSSSSLGGRGTSIGGGSGNGGSSIGGISTNGGVTSSGGITGSGGLSGNAGTSGGGGISGSGGIFFGTGGSGGAGGGCNVACAANEVCIDSSCVCRSGELHLVSVSPRNSAVGVARSSAVTASLSCAPAPSILDQSVLTALGEQGGPLRGTLQHAAASREVVFQPGIRNSGWKAPCFPGELITARVSRELGGPYISQFFAEVTRPSSARFSIGQTITSAETRHVAIGDLDSDGDLDIAIEYVSEGTHVWQNDGFGSFTDSGQLLSNCGALALGDLDTDGDLDLICLPQVFINDGTGAFQALPASGLPAAAEDIKLGDLDGDGDLDAAIIGGGDAIFINNGSGSFTQAQPLTGLVGYPHRLATGDLDNDGDLDLILSGWLLSSNPPIPGQAVLFNDGAGVFTRSAQDFGTSLSIGVDVGDLDGDGDLDAFVGNWDINGVNHVWINDGTGNFTVRQTTPTNIVAGVALGDADGDGDLDAYIACGSVYGQTRLLLNDGAGNFSDTGQSLGLLYAQYIVPGDLNGDGALDAVFTAGNAAAGIWLNGP